MAKGKRSKKWWFLGGAAVLILVVAAVARPRKPVEDEKAKIKTAKAEIGDVQVRVTEVGSVEPQVKVDVKSVLSGKVVELLVREGDPVSAGPGARARRARRESGARPLPGEERRPRGRDRPERGALNVRAQPGPARPGPAVPAGRPRERDPLPDGQRQPRRGVREVPHRPGERRADRAGPDRRRRAPQRDLAHGRRGDPPSRGAGRHGDVGRVVLQRRNGAHDGGRHRDDDRQGRHQRGRHRQGPSRASR